MVWLLTEPETVAQFVVHAVPEPEIVAEFTVCIVVERPRTHGKILAEPETVAEFTVCVVVELETVLEFMAKSLQSLRLSRNSWHGGRTA